MRTLACLLGLALLAAACRPATPTPEPTPAGSEASPPGSPFDVDWSDRSTFAPGLVTSHQGILSRLPGASVYHLELTIADDLASAQGVEEVLYTNTEAEPLDRVALHLFPNLLGGEMMLSTVRVEGVDAEPVYGDGNGSAAIALDPALQPGASLEIRLEFSVSIPSDIMLNYGMFANNSGVLAYAHGYPMIAVFDSDGWNVEIPPLLGDITYADASFYLVRVHAPKDLVLCTSGIEIDRGEVDGRQAVTFAAGPARDFYLAASREFEVLTDTAGPVTLRVCTPGYGLEAGRRILAVAAEALDVFGQRYGEYPYTELDMITTPTLASGIEYPGAFALTDRLFTQEEDFEGAAESVYLESTVAHETAHEWFYNLVGNDQLDDPWLDEALAQYAMFQYYAATYGDSGAQGTLSSFYDRWDRVDRQAIAIGMPVGAYDERSYAPIIYGRGPLFIIALRDAMGVQAFDAFLRQYAATFAWEEAAPQDLKQLAEVQCGCDLTPLFNAWVYPRP